MQLNEYIETLKKELLKYGFSYDVLTVSEISKCWFFGKTIDECYGVACDVNSGFSFDESFAASS